MTQTKARPVTLILIKDGEPSSIETHPDRASAEAAIADLLDATFPDDDDTMRAYRFECVTRAAQFLRDGSTIRAGVRLLWTA